MQRIHRVEAVNEQQRSYILGLLDSSAGIRPSVTLYGHSDLWPTCHVRQSAIRHWRLGGMDVLIPLQSGGNGWAILRFEGQALYHKDKMICLIFIMPEGAFSPSCSSASAAEGKHSLARQDGVSPSESWDQARSSKKRDIDAPGQYEVSF